jgi:hypothetical protein
MELTTCKYMERWYEKAYRVVEQIDYISALQKGQDTKEHGIRVLRDRNISRIRKAVEYWVSMAHEPQKKIQKKWVECERIWEKINREMKDIGLLEFVSPEDFLDLHDIFKRHEEQDSA